MENQELNPPLTQTTSGSKLVYVLIVVLVLVFGGIGGYLLGAKKTTVPEPTKIPKSATKYPAATASDEMAGWKTYINNKYGYLLQYPSNWMVKESCFTDPNTDATCFSSNDFEYDPADFGTSKGGQIRIDGKDYNLGLSPDSFCETTPTSPEKCEYYSVEGLSFVRRLSAPYAMTVGLIKNNKILLILRVMFNQTSQNETIKTFDQILSTFKFLDETKTVSDKQITYDLLKNLARWKTVEDVSNEPFLNVGKCANGESHNPAKKVFYLSLGPGDPDTIPSWQAVFQNIQDVITQNGWVRCTPSDNNPDGTIPNETFIKNGQLLHLEKFGSMGTGYFVSVQFEYSN